jgi:2,3-bisphosphoglycerate-independent phosphoglycerate mutase
MAETEKYAHVTYFFNGFRDESFVGQTKFLIPSRNVQSHAEHPEMKAQEIADKLIESINAGTYDIMIVNFANADMVAHTGNFEAELVALKTVDEQLARVVKLCEEKGIYMVITADHGNAEVMVDSMTGQVETSHDPNPVPLYIVGPEYKRSKSLAQAKQTETSVAGILSDVAPTILEILGIAQPKEMTGQSLLNFLD